jgi:hypothetical protein
MDVNSMVSAAVLILSTHSADFSPHKPQRRMIQRMINQMAPDKCLVWKQMTYLKRSQKTMPQLQNQIIKFIYGSESTKQLVTVTAFMLKFYSLPSCFQLPSDAFLAVTWSSHSVNWHSHQTILLVRLPVRLHELEDFH